jgi:SpoVK/Ycf46/Vps4 family AAA+-type ATPase
MAAVISLLSKDIALSTGGYVAADLSALVSELVLTCQAAPAPAVMKSVSSSSTLEGHPSSIDPSPEHVQDLVMSAVQIAKKSVAPSCLRGATIALPHLTYDDVIGYPEVKKNLSRVLSFSSAASREKLIKFGQNTMLGGVLLHGPPGNSKTRLVQAAAATHGLPMISLSSADVYSAYVGDSEAEIRRVFNLARQSHPCVLFMDEIDALVTNRQEESSSNNVESRVLSTLLNEMDGIDGGGNGVFVIAATNRIDFIDSALLRKGRFHHLLHVPLPNIDEKNQLLGYFAKRFGINAASVDEITPKLSNVNISGADVENLCREAGMTKIRDFISLSKKE